MLLTWMAISVAATPTTSTVRFTTTVSREGLASGRTSGR